MRRVSALIFVISIFAGLAVAHGGGGMGSGTGGMGFGGAGMLTVADDGSILVTEISSMMGGGPGGGMAGDDRALINIDPAGNERWRATFDDGWPMMPVNDGSLVILVLREDWWNGSGAGGDGDWTHGGNHGGGHGGGGGGLHADTSTLVGLDLATGNELWRTVVDGDMVSAPQFAPDGTQFYVTVRDLNETGGGLGSGSMRQGGAPGAHELMNTSVVAIGRDGAVVWSADLGGGGQKVGRIR